MTVGKSEEFFIYLLEQYAACKAMDAGAVLRLWDDAGLTDTIRGMYDLYHVEAPENAFADIDLMLQERRA